MTALRDARVWAVLGALAAIAILDVLLSDVGFVSLLAIPVVASIALGRAAWTAGFGVVALALFIAVSVSDGSTALQFWRRLSVLVVTCLVSVWLARLVERARERVERESRAFQLMAENSTDVVFRGSNDGVLEWVSSQSASLVQWQPDEMIGRPFRDFVHPDDIPKVAAANAALLEGKSASPRLRIRTAGGTYRWVAALAKPTFDDHGHVTGRVGGWTDIDDLVHAREEAERRREETRSIFDSQLDPFIEFSPVRDESGRIVDLRVEQANPPAFAYNRSTPAEMIGTTFLTLFPGLLDHGPMQQYLDCAENGTPVVLDDYAYDNDILGEPRRYDIRAVRTDVGMALTWRDVTDRYRAVEQLAESERRYRLLAEKGSEVIWQLGDSGEIQWSSESTLPVLGYSAADVVGRRAIEFVHPEDLDGALAGDARALVGGEIRQECRIRRADGSLVWMALGVSDLAGPDGLSRIATLRDIDAEVSAREELARVVGRDPLTGLMTREAMESRIQSALDQMGPGRVALLCVGLDSLSAVNEAFTHAVGDVVLATTAARIVDEVGDPDLVARGAGVDFIVLCPTEAEASDAATLAERIRQDAGREMAVGAHRIRLTVSIGIATGSPEDGPEHLVRSATLAMRTAKAAGRDRVAFAVPELAVEAERRLTLTADIAQGLDANEFTGWYQPVHDLRTGTREGYEALARWVRADGVVVEPADFLPVTERSAMIVQIDLAVLRTTLATLALLPSSQFIAVNVSARSLLGDDYADALLDCLVRSGVDGSRLHLEITETALLDVSDDVVQRMTRIARSGAQWYVDDFGTGFSSISHLRDLPVSGLKLDISFARGVMAGDGRSIQLARALAGLAEGLGLDSVAEGVMTQEHADLLSRQGWRRGQGWFYGKPAPISAHNG